MNTRKIITIAAITLASIPTLATMANAQNSAPDISPEYTWMNDLPAIIAAQTQPAPAAETPTAHTAIVASDPVTVEAPVTSGGVTTDPDVIHGMNDPVHYTGPVVATGVPGGTVITDHAVGAASDPRVVRCDNGGTFPAASVSQPGFVDNLIAEGHCTVVN